MSEDQSVPWWKLELSKKDLRIQELEEDLSKMFCKTHGYIVCECPEENGLSLKEFKDLTSRLSLMQSYVKHKEICEVNRITWKKGVRVPSGKCDCGLDKAISSVAVEPSGLCSAHRDGENKDCRICYPSIHRKPEGAVEQKEHYGGIRVCLNHGVAGCYCD